MFKYTTEEVKDKLKTNDHVLSELRKGLIKGVDFEYKNHHRYSESGLSKLKSGVIERDVNILDFVKQVQSETGTDGYNQTMIDIAMMEYLTDKGYKNHEIAKRLKYTKDSVQVMKSRVKNDFTYLTIKEKIYKIGDRNEVTK